MGAKQSKRSVDISGKEAENVGEVAAAGAGGEGRMEPLADADALKPQINGDAHIHEQSDKEKQLDSGTPENEKDATTEKESKEQEENKEKETVPVVNGENGEQKENGDSSPAPEDGKKPKKEKVKKKWSLRSISFSRKEKPKQEKKQKEEEPKTNGEPEKVPEEAAEVTPEAPKTETAEEPKPDTESKDEKTPETPVTEPITNGSSTPESKAETPAAEEPALAVPETNRPEAKAEPEPEQLPVNGLSLEEAKHEPAEAPQSEESKPEEPIAETTESTPAPEIPVIKEVCVEQMPLEPTPPPLPANPPPSSVASFAATTMAPELTDASLANITESAIIPPSYVALETKPSENKPNESPLVKNIESELNSQPPSLKEADDCKPEEVVNAENEAQTQIIKNVEAEVETTPRLKEVSEENPVEEVNVEPVAQSIEASPIIANVEPEQELLPLNEINDEKIVEVVKSEPEQHLTNNLVEASDKIETNDELNEKPIENNLSEAIDLPAPITEDAITDEISESEPCISPPAEPEIPENPDVLDSVEDLPPPPPADELIESGVVENVEAADKVSDKVEVISNHVSEIVSETNGIDKESINGIDEDEAGPAAGAPACNGTAQEPLPVSDKIADLIPEVPIVPELKTESETTSDVAVTN